MDSLQAKYKSVVEQVLRDYAEFLDNDDQVQMEPYSIRRAIANHSAPSTPKSPKFLPQVERLKASLTLVIVVN